MPNDHACNLPSRNMPNESCLPKLAPNSCWAKRCLRQLRQQFLMNHKHFRCTRLFRSISSILAEKRRHASGPYYYVIHPLSSFSLFLELGFFLLWSYGLIVEPLMIFMNDISAMWWFSDVILSWSRMVIIALFFNVGYVDKHTKRVVLAPRIIIRRYLKTYFIFDFLTTHYSLEYVFNFIIEDETLRFKFKLSAYIIRTVASCVRVSSLLGYLNECLSHLHYRRVVRYLLIYAIRTYMYLHVSTFFIYLVPRVIYTGKYTPADSWISQANRSKTMPMATALKYFECLLMSSCYFFGLEHKYYLYLLNEQICFVIVTLFGRLYTLFLLADVLNLLGVTSLSESKYDRRMSMLRHYMAENQLSNSTQQNMLKYCKLKFQGHYFKEEVILDMLSEGLRAEMFLFSAKCMIQKVGIFRKMPAYTLADILATMTARYYSARDVIVKTGAVVNEIYFISSGTVAVMNASGEELCHLEDGEIFGISCLVLQQQMYIIIAVEATQVYVIDKSTLLKLLDRGLTERLYTMAVHRLDVLYSLSGRHVEGKRDFLSELRRGHILEKLTKRTVVDS